jgi:hypothetical protein
MSAAELPHADNSDDEPQLWRTVELDDETIDALRRILFGARTVTEK